MDDADRDTDLDGLLARLRAEPEPRVVAEVASGLPARVGARLREEREAGRHARLWITAALASLTAICVVCAALTIRELDETTLLDPQAILLFWSPG